MASIKQIQVDNTTYDIDAVTLGGSLPSYYASASALSDYIPLSGTTSIYGNLVPSANNNVNYGTSNKVFANIYGTNIYGDVTGNTTGSIVAVVSSSYATLFTTTGFTYLMSGTFFGAVNLPAVSSGATATLATTDMIAHKYQHNIRMITGPKEGSSWSNVILFAFINGVSTSYTTPAGTSDATSYVQTVMNALYDVGFTGEGKYCPAFGFYQDTQTASATTGLYLGIAGHSSAAYTAHVYTVNLFKTARSNNIYVTTLNGTELPADGTWVTATFSLYSITLTDVVVTI